MPNNPSLERAFFHANTFLETLSKRPVHSTTSIDELRQRLGRSLPQNGVDETQVIDELVADVEGGLLASTGGRFFGWVIGGTIPAAAAADWLTSIWDQNAAASACSPATAVIEEICGTWLKDILNIPSFASFGFVTGCQAAHTTAFAAARHKLLIDRGWNVERKGLSGAPPIRLITSDSRHESLIRSMRLLGLGSDLVESVPCDPSGSISLSALDVVLSKNSEQPTIVCLQAGDLNTGAFDPFKEAIPLAKAKNAWVHVDGAFGLWAATSEKYRPLLEGVDAADSWATDGHKWLNLPFDNGFVFVSDPRSHSAVLTQPTSYSIPIDGVRNPMDWNLEWSRRARGYPVYAALRALGRNGLEDLVNRSCLFAEQLVSGIGQLQGVEILAHPIINQGLVRFISKSGDHDARTDQVIDRIQEHGHVWFGGTTWRGQRAMRISVCNWRTTDDDVKIAIDAVRLSLATLGD